MSRRKKRTILGWRTREASPSRPQSLLHRCKGVLGHGLDTFKCAVICLSHPFELVYLHVWDHGFQVGHVDYAPLAVLDLLVQVLYVPLVRGSLNLVLLLVGIAYALTYLEELVVLPGGDQRVLHAVDVRHETFNDLVSTADPQLPLLNIAVEELLEGLLLHLAILQQLN